jgi:hypothetical protein
MMSEPVERSAAKSSTDEKDQSYLAIPNDLQPAALECKEIDVTIVKREPRSTYPTRPGTPGTALQLVRSILLARFENLRRVWLSHFTARSYSHSATVAVP